MFTDDRRYLVDLGITDAPGRLDDYSKHPVLKNVNSFGEMVKI